MTHMQTNSKEFFSRIETALNDLQNAFDPLSGGPPKYYFEKMTEWMEALFDTAPFKVGDKVELVQIPNIQCHSGWWCYRNTFQLGAIGTVKELDFREGQFTAMVIWDEQWVESTFPEISQKKMEDRGEKGLFCMWETQLVLHSPSTKWIQWRGSKTQQEKGTRIEVWEKEVAPLLGPGSTIQPKHSIKHELLGWLITNPRNKLDS